MMNVASFLNINLFRVFWAFRPLPSLFLFFGVFFVWLVGFFPRESWFYRDSHLNITDHYGSEISNLQLEMVYV